MKDQMIMSDYTPTDSRTLKISLAVNLAMTAFIGGAILVFGEPREMIIAAIVLTHVNALIDRNRRAISHTVLRRIEPVAHLEEARRIIIKTHERLRLQEHADGIPLDADMSAVLWYTTPRTPFQTYPFARTQGCMSVRRLAREVESAMKACLTRRQIARFALELGRRPVELPSPPLSAHEKIEIEILRRAEKQTDIPTG